MKNPFKKENKKAFINISIDINGEKLDFKVHDSDEGMHLEVDRKPGSFDPVLNMFQVRLMYILDQFLDEPESFIRRSTEDSVELAKKAGLPEDFIELGKQLIKERIKDEDSKTTLH